MIIGNGMIASKFSHYKYNKRVIIFASGVSNSTETEINKFNREKELLIDTLHKYKNKFFIYFSSCSIENNELKDTPYHIHKRAMELQIKQLSNNYLIIRLPNVIGNFGNNNTIINFFFNNIKNNNDFVVWKNATRNIIDIEDVYSITSYIIDKKIFINQTLNIAYDSNINVMDIISAIEMVLNKKASYQIQDKGFDIKINNEKIKYIMQKLSIKQPNIIELIKKYKGNS